MDVRRKAGLTVAPLLSALMLGGCVSQSDYDALKAQNEVLQGQNQQLRRAARRRTDTGRPAAGGIKYTINSDLLFPPGSWTIRRVASVFWPIWPRSLPFGQRINVSLWPAIAEQCADRPEPSRPKRHVQGGTLAKASGERLCQFLISRDVEFRA